ncbi:MAG: peptidoglycan-binding domain-containing protein [Acidimicrobiales bacterium]
MSYTDGGYTGSDVAPGEQGEHIAELQARLIEFGFTDLPTDGVVGDSTQEALTTFAADRNLTEGTFKAAVARVAQETRPLRAARWVRRFENPDATYGYMSNTEAG